MIEKAPEPALYSPFSLLVASTIMLKVILKLLLPLGILLLNLLVLLRAEQRPVPVNSCSEKKPMPPERTAQKVPGASSYCVRPQPSAASILPALLSTFVSSPYVYIV
jgi:hypothetical protein